MVRSKLYIKNGTAQRGTEKQAPNLPLTRQSCPSAPASEEVASSPQHSVQPPAQHKTVGKVDTSSFFKNKSSFNRKKLPQIRQEFSLYTLWVQFSKYFLPIISLILVVIVGIWPSLNEPIKNFNLDSIHMQQREEGNLAMINARYRGIDKERRRFSIRAASTSQNRQLDTIYELEKPEADIIMTDGTWLALSSSYGFYDRESQQLDLLDQVNLYYNAGHEFQTNTAHLSLEDNSAYGSSPIKGQSPIGKLSAQGFKILEQGNIILFTGKSYLTLYANQDY